MLRKLPLFRLYRQIRQTVPPDSRGMFTSTLVLGMVRSLLDLAGVAMVFPIIKIIVQPESVQESRWLRAWYAAGGFTSTAHFAEALIASVVCMFVLRALVTWYFVRRQSNIVFGITERIALTRFMSYLRMPYRFYTEQNTSLLLRNFLVLPFEFGQRVMVPYVQLISELMIVLMMLGLMMFYKPLLFVSIVVLLSPAALLFQLTMRRMLRETATDKDHSSNEMYKESMQAMEMFREIKLANAYGYFKDRFTRGLQTLAALTARITTLNEVSSKVVDLIAVAGIGCVFLLSRFLSLTSAQLVEFLGVFVIVIARLIPSFNRIILYTNTIRTNEYVFGHLSDLPPMESLRALNGHATPMPFASTIVLDELLFGYDARVQVLSNVALQIDRGKTVGIVGTSGSGKTTLLNVLLRLFDEQRGGIYVDGVKVTADNRDAWYKLIGFVPQNINLLDDNLTRNIAFGVPDDEVDMDKVRDVARRAQLMPWIEQQANGLDTRVGESGVKLSGGQRQRIGIARALYTDAQILIFDEATSQLDLKTEEQITDSIRALSHKDLTIVIVAHRLQTLRYCDAIYRLENGKLGSRLAYADLLNA